MAARPRPDPEMTMVAIGDTAPDFTLWSNHLESVTLSSLRDRNVVLNFFPFVNTGICTEQMCHFRDMAEEYEGLDAHVLGMSVDSPFSLKLWAETHAMTATLVSDFNKQILPQYDAMMDVWVPGKWALNGAARRGAAVIDKQGIIHYHEVSDDPGQLPDFEAIRAVLTELD